MKAWRWWFLWLVCASGCERSPRTTASQQEPPAGGEGAAGAAAPTTGASSDAAMRAAMVEDQIAARGVTDRRVLEAMRTVPRHAFVPGGLASMAYDDTPLPIGEDQTISQPYIVARMTELARVDPESRVLEIGTGSGYQAAVLAEIAGADDVYSIEINARLARRAADTLARLGHDGVHLRTGDGYAGWAEAAPFDAIIVTAAPPRVPESLRQQLAIGGRLVIPVGEHYQKLLVITRESRTRFREDEVFPVAFVPMLGEAQGEGQK
jgi:protein-L-isoaspartate(D-aspartate) O-methyltransferase